MKRNGYEIAVIGIACQFPHVKDVDEYWAMLVEGKSVIDSFSKLDDDPYYVNSKGVLEFTFDFDNKFFGISPKEAEIIDPQQRRFLQIAWQALEDSGYVVNYDGKVGVFAGSGQNTYFYEYLIPKYGLTGLEKLNVSFINSGTDFLSTLVSYKMNLKGPSINIQTACSTSLASIHYACQSILSGESDIAIAGGVSLQLDLEKGYKYSEGGIFSSDGKCMPFDDSSSGTVPGSGVGAVVLKLLDEAIRDNDHIYALIKGSSINNDGSEKIGYTAPSKKSQVSLIEDAINMAQIAYEDIAFIEAHGTGTKLGDPIEIAALYEAIAIKKTDPLIVGSVKANIGHSDAASGVAGFIKAVLSLQNRLVPSNINFNSWNHNINVDKKKFLINKENINLFPRENLCAGVSSFGIGGTNVHVILEEYTGKKYDNFAVGEGVICLSAKSAKSLKQIKTSFARYFKGKVISLPELESILFFKRKHFRFRTAKYVKSMEELEKWLTESSNICIGKSERKIAFAFPGQGSQFAHMGNALYNSSEVFRTNFNIANGIVKDEAEFDMLGFITSGEKDVLENTRYMQPMLFSLEYCLALMLMEMGIKPDYMIGHSIGEFVAATLAGVFTFEDAVRLVAIRGKLMSSTKEGLMIAIKSSIDEVKNLLVPGLEISILNSQNSFVVGGNPKKIKSLKSVLNERDISCKILLNSHAFHSQDMEEVRDELENYIRILKMKKPVFRWISNVTGDFIEPEEVVTAEYWGRHLVCPVEFSKGISYLIKEECDFLEVGPGKTLEPLISDNELYSQDVKIKSLLIEDHIITKKDIYGLMWSWGHDEFLAGYLKKLDINCHLPEYQFDENKFCPDIDRGNQYFGLQMQNSIQEFRENIFIKSVEEIVSECWQDALGILKIEKEDNVFELGAHSLLAIRIASKLRELFGVKIQIKDIVSNPTVIQLTALVEEKIRCAEIVKEKVKLPKFEPDIYQKKEKFPLTDLARGYYIGRSEAIVYGNSGSQIYYEYKLNKIGIEKLEIAFNQLILRHPMLRAWVDENGSQQILTKVPYYNFEYFIVSNNMDMDTIRENLIKPQPANKWPYFRVAIINNGDDKIIALKFDYLIIDALSYQIISDELKKLYLDSNELNSIRVQYKDYMHYLKDLEYTQAFEDDMKYWQERLAGNSNINSPELPIKEGVQQSANLTSHIGKLGKTDWERLRRMCIDNSISMSGIMLAVYCEVLAMYSNSNRFIVNMPTFNRLQIHEDINNIVGTFTSITLFLIELDFNKNFLDRAREMQKKLYEDLDHNLVNGLRVIRELKKSNPEMNDIMPIVFTGLVNSSNINEKMTWMDWIGEEITRINQTPQVFIDNQIEINEAGEMVYTWDVLEEIFQPGVISAMFTSYKDCLKALCCSEDVWYRQFINNVPKEQLGMRSKNNYKIGEKTKGFLQNGFLAAEALRPKSIAVVQDNENLTYHEILVLAECVKEHVLLKTKGKTLVPIIMRKEWEFIPASLGVLMSGCAFVPIDAEYPHERIEKIMQACNARIYITSESSKESMSWCTASQIILSKDMTSVTEVKAPFDCTPDDLAYIIFTSGSTGEPKGVMISHGAVVNTIQDINQRYNVTKNDKVINISSYSFDLSIYDIFGLLSAGGTVIIPNDNERINAAYWIELIKKYDVTIWNTVPALMGILADETNNSAQILPSLRLVMLSGDWISLTLFDKVKSIAKDAKFISLGGATEGSIWSIFYEVTSIDSKWKSIPYGHALSNQHMYIYDNQLRECPDWVCGDIYIGGLGVAKGYWADEDRTIESFLIHPQTGEYIYKTGDRGRYMSDGNIEFLGRQDNQVKVNGFRIELGEIEKIVLQLPQIGYAKALDILTEAGGRAIALAVVLKGNENISEDDLKKYIGDSLPYYMIPSRVSFMEELPLTNNGKIDMKQLSQLFSKVNNGTFVGKQAESNTEKELVEIWMDAFSKKRISIDTNFYELGGDSLMAIQIISRINKKYSINLKIYDFFRLGSIEKLAEQINELLKSNGNLEEELAILFSQK